MPTLDSPTSSNNCTNNCTNNCNCRSSCGNTRDSTHTLNSDRDTVTLKGQIVHVRKCYRRLFFIDLRISLDTKVTVLFRSDDNRHSIPELNDQELISRWKRVRKGDIVSLECFQAAPDEIMKRAHPVYQAIDFEVIEAWPGFDPFPTEPAMGLLSTPPTNCNKHLQASKKKGNPSIVNSGETGRIQDTEGIKDGLCWKDYCKYWINSQRCMKADCNSRHPVDKEYTLARQLWVEERARVRKERSKLEDDPHDHSSKVPHSQRALIFSKWLVAQYGPDFLNSGTGVLDVAGGKGEISLFLRHMFRVQSTVVEPKARKDKPYQRKYLMDIIQKHLDTEADEEGHIHGPVRAATTDSCLRGSRDALEHKLEQRMARKVRLSQFEVPRLVAMMDDCFQHMYPGVLESASILIGMHPDQATEAIVDMAIRHGKPFAVVPCCVFAHDNPQRRLMDGGRVNTTVEFVEYLMEKDSSGKGGEGGKTRKEFLPFDGMNIVVYQPRARHSNP